MLVTCAREVLLQLFVNCWGCLWCWVWWKNWIMSQREIPQILHIKFSLLRIRSTTLWTCCIISSVALINNPDNVIMLSWLETKTIYNRKPVLPTWCIEFERCLPDRQGLMKDLIKMHCGKFISLCFWHWPTSGTKTQDISGSTALIWLFFF